MQGLQQILRLLFALRHVGSSLCGLYALFHRHEQLASAWYQCPIQQAILLALA